jgi:hypothetical protein
MTAQPLSHVLATNAQILVAKLPVDPMLNAQLLARLPNVLVCLDFCPTQLLLLGVPDNQHLVWPTTNVPLDSNVMPNFADPCVTQTVLACLMSCVLTMFARKSASLTMIVDLTKFAKVSNVYLDAGPIKIAQSPSHVKTTNASIHAALLNVE